MHNMFCGIQYDVIHTKRLGLEAAAATHKVSRGRISLVILTLLD